MEIAQVEKWTLPARILHWTVAAGVLWQLATGRLSDAVSDRDVSEQILAAHVQIGVLMAALILLRVLWRLGHRPPASLADEPAWSHRTANGVHALFYGLLIVLPISGFVVWDYFDWDLALFGKLHLPDLFTPTEDERFRAGAWYTHAAAGWILTGLIVLHVGATAWHAFVRRDKTLARML